MRHLRSPVLAYELSRLYEIAGFFSCFPDTSFFPGFPVFHSTRRDAPYAKILTFLEQNTFLIVAKDNNTNGFR